jgi:hypothetical protein
VLRFLFLFVAPLVVSATEGKLWNWPTDGFHVALSVGGDQVPGTTVTPGRPLVVIPVLAQFEERRDATYDLRYSIVISRDGETVFRELNRHLNGVRDSKTHRKYGVFGPAVRWDVPGTLAPGIYRLTIIARDALGGKSVRQSYDVTIKQKG